MPDPNPSDGKRSRVTKAVLHKELDNSRRRVEELEQLVAERDLQLATNLRESSLLSLAFRSINIRAWRWTAEDRTTRFLHGGSQLHACQEGFSHPDIHSDLELLAAIHPDDRKRVTSLWDRCYSEHTAYDVEYRTVHAEGKIHYNREIGSPEFDQSGQYLGHCGTTQDTSEQKLVEFALEEARDELQLRIGEQREAETQIRELAYYDTVTRLPNRVLLKQHLQQAIGAAQRHNFSLAVLFIDLDHFKRINDTWGHSAGDQLLYMVGERLTECLRLCDIVARSDVADSAADTSNHTIARLGGDEFVILLPELRRAEDAAAVAQRINKVLSLPFTVLGNEVFISSSIGISVYPDDGNNGEALLTHADGAMYEVKAEGRNDYRFYTADIQARAFTRLNLEANLRRALQKNEFILHYQPKMDIASGRIIGMEALLRWNKPGAGLVSPDEFIPTAEEIGLIVPLGAWVLETACAQTAAWHAAGFAGLCLSVNLSAAQMRHPNLAEVVSGSLASSGLDAKYLELELTESLLMDDVEAHIERLHELKALGVKLSIDDFGTGYSSLSYLKRFPIDTLKIDRSFIIDIENGPDDAAIVKGVIGLAHSLRLRVVAEGVEKRRQLDLLRSYDCDEVQGYYFSKPLPVDEFVTWVDGLKSDTDNDSRRFIDKDFAA